ncbi:dUTP diphosphatase [Candidatus Woesearchaeota archaeon]|jgi:dUTP pyrophosphatase|nr:dUTP diphosphatase [Candidatus Woesearchaeota archaeon]MBT4835032.1 dUTP diphosphatase [Candidatus Woesearchaeota archaeon]MBT6735349.1 dUTP diphosphatase [Candidatus Woesearchaeota archaeon]MBT7169683.1 dUTP diphosphatase [Candidatus Woesearchaeota archaeon]MBT7474794.1 dUTP diphosphatase [Candidatus Woesearchaeota archaeon]
MKIKFQKIHEDAIIPKYAKLGDAGMDVTSVENYSINPGEHVLVKTGLKMELPEGYEAQVRPRSGLALKHKITVLNSPGTIDSGYRGEAGVILMNHGKEVFSISKGDRIAQFVIAKHESPEVEEVESLEDSERGEGGFGSTGL